MSFVVACVTFLVGIPVAIWTLACILGLVDQKPKVTPLIRLSVTLTLIALFLLATSRELWLPLAWAFALVFLGHLISGVVFRSFALGIDNVHPTLASDESEKGPRRQGIGEGRGSQSPGHFEDEDDPPSPS